jgi:hypothetical protein
MLKKPQHAQAIVHGDDDGIGGGGEVRASYIGSAV